MTSLVVNSQPEYMYTVDELLHVLSLVKNGPADSPNPQPHFSRFANERLVRTTFYRVSPATGDSQVFAGGAGLVSAWGYWVVSLMGG